MEGDNCAMANTLKSGLQQGIQSLLLGAIAFYKSFISPWLPPACRYEPTCSCYARSAIEIHGPWRGTRLALGRILRCNPWGGSGYDPVPPRLGLLGEDALLPTASPGIGDQDLDARSGR